MAQLNDPKWAELGQLGDPPQVVKDEIIKTAPPDMEVGDSDPEVGEKWEAEYLKREESS